MSLNPENLPTTEDLRTEAWHDQRFQEMKLASALSPSGRANLADDEGIPDDGLEEAASFFGSTYGRSGWGTSVILEDLLARDPGKIKVDDLAGMQEGLIAQGYMPPGAPVDGIWTPEYNSAFRRLNRDSMDMSRSGGRWLAAPVSAGIRVLGYVMPSNVYQGVVGSARGIMDQVGETQGRLGAAGGALQGAAIGGTIGGFAGAGLGLLVGAGVGFLWDFFGIDEEEEDDSLRERFLDALSPFDEYREQGVNALWEDLGFILSAASAVSGLKLAATGGVRAWQTATGARSGLMAQGATPGLATTARGFWMKQVPDDVGRSVTTRISARLIKGSGFKTQSEWFTEQAVRRGFRAQATRPLLRGVSDVGSGLARGQLGVRMSGGLGTGTTQRTDIEKALQEAPEMPYGHLADWTLGMIWAPKGFLPIGDTSITRAKAGLPERKNMLRLAGQQAITVPFKELFSIRNIGQSLDEYVNNAALKASFMHVATKPVTEEVAALGVPGAVVGQVPSLKVAQKIVDTALKGVRAADGSIELDDVVGTMRMMKLRTDVGIGQETARRVMEKGYQGGEIDFQKAWEMTRAEVKRDLFDSLHGDDQSFFHSLMQHTRPGDETGQGPMKLAAFIEESESFGGDLARLVVQDEADKVVRQINHAIFDEGAEVTIHRGLKGFGSREKPFGRLDPAGVDLRKHISDTRSEAARQRKYFKAEKDPKKAIEFKKRADELDAEARELQTATTETAEGPQEWRVTVARKNDPDKGVPGYVTEQDFHRFSAEYLSLRNRAQMAAEANNADELGAAVADMKNFMQGLMQRRAINRKAYDAATGTNVPEAWVADYLKSKGGYHAKEITIKDPKLKPLVDQLDQQGYRLIVTPDEMLYADDFDDLAQQLDNFGVAEYTKRQGFFESIGMSPFRHTDRVLFSMRMASEQNVLQGILHRNGIKMTGQEAMRRIHDYLADFNHGRGATTIGPFVKRTKPGARTGSLEETGKYLYRVDTRELKPDWIHEALDLDEWVPASLGDEIIDAASGAKVADDVDALQPGEALDPGGAGFAKESIEKSPRRGYTDSRSARARTPEAVAKEIYHGLKRGAAYGGETDWQHPMQAARMLGRAMRVNGLPGFGDFVRTFQLKSPARAGALIGGSVSAYTGVRDEDADLWEIIMGTAKGAGAGALMGHGAAMVPGWTHRKGMLDKLLKTKFKEGHYGYLPDHLHRVNMALRYSLSFVFDMGRYTEQNMLGMVHGIPGFLVGRKAVKRWAKDMGVNPDEAWHDSIRLWDEINGTNKFAGEKGMMRVVDDIDRRMFQRGLLAFSPRHHEAAQMWYLKNVLGKKNNEIEEIISQVGRYGVGRTAAEKSTNFLFFPFSFQKKFMTQLSDFIMQEPARAMLIYEGFRLLNENKLDAKLGGIIEKHFPLWDQLKYVNTLGMGFSIGRPLLEGVNEQDTDLGKAAQMIASVFVPSGAATPVAQAAGKLTDLAASGSAHFNGFMPIGVSGENTEGLVDIFNTYIPFTRDLQNFWEGLGAQKAVLTSGLSGGKWLSPQAQEIEYEAKKLETKQKYEGLATAMGYASVESFLGSNVGAAYARKIEREQNDMALEYPDAVKAEAEIYNKGALNEIALHDLAKRPDLTQEEEWLLEVAAMDRRAKTLATVLGYSIGETQQMIAPSLRKFALGHQDNPRFALLYRQFFENTYGPIEGIKLRPEFGLPTSTAFAGAEGA